MLGNFMAGISISQNIRAVLHFQELPLAVACVVSFSSVSEFVFG